MNFKHELLAMALLFAAPVAAPDATAQEADPPLLTLADIHNSSKFSGESFLMGRWASDGPEVLYVTDDAEPDGSTSIIRYNLRSREETTIVDGAHLRAPETGELISIEDYSFSADGRRALIFTDTEPVWRQNTKGYYYIYDLPSG